MLVSRTSSRAGYELSAQPRDWSTLLNMDEGREVVCDLMYERKTDREEEIKREAEEGEDEGELRNDSGLCQRNQLRNT